MTKEQKIKYLQEHYPNTTNDILCNHLGMSLSALQTLANRNNIHKSKEYLLENHKRLMKAKEKAYLATIPQVSLTEKEQNIIVGSILGDGSLSFSPRSRNAHYREHYSYKQREYRIWKMNSIDSIQFRIEKDVHLKSPSHPIFTELYNQFYYHGRKTITSANVKLLTHPIGLACLYLDDGTLMISAQCRRYNNVYITPSIGLATMCFSGDECEILKQHILDKFSIEFKVKKYPSTKGYILVCQKIDDVYKFYETIHPFCCSIKSMRYKWDIEYRLAQEYFKQKQKYGCEYNIRISHTDDISPNYSPNEEAKMIQMKKDGFSDREIAQSIGRTYWGVVDKLRRIRQAGKL